MARRNYIKLTNGDDCLIIGFYKPCGEIIDVIDTIRPYINLEEQNKINRWIFDGISPSEDEDIALVKAMEKEAYGK